MTGQYLCTVFNVNDVQRTDPMGSLIHCPKSPSEVPPPSTLTQLHDSYLQNLWNNDLNYYDMEGELAESPQAIQDIL